MSGEAVLSCSLKYTTGKHAAELRHRAMGELMPGLILLGAKSTSTDATAVGLRMSFDMHPISLV